MMSSSLIEDVSSSLSSLILVLFTYYRRLSSWSVFMVAMYSSTPTNSPMLYSEVSQMGLNRWTILKFKSSRELSTTKIAMVFHCWWELIARKSSRFWMAFSRLFPKCNYLLLFLLLFSWDFRLFSFLSCQLFNVSNTFMIWRGISCSFSEHI